MSRPVVAAPVGPPCVRTSSGGRSPAGPVNAAFAGRYRKAWAVAPSVEGNSSASGVEIASGGASVPAARPRTSVRRLATSTPATTGPQVGEAPRNTALPASAATLEMSEKPVSIGSNRPRAASRTASVHDPRRAYAQTMRSGPANPYMLIPRLHCGAPNSASIACSRSARPPRHR